MLHSIDEVDLWEESAQRYVNDYQLTQQNDLLLLGAILSQQLAMFRAQQRMNGMAPELDDGAYRQVSTSARRSGSATSQRRSRRSRRPASRSAS
jgi:hypothetical protein